MFSLLENRYIRGKNSLEIIKDVERKKQYLSMLDEKCLCLFHDTQKVCGIYAILNKQNGKVYIGKTTTKIFHYIRTERLYKLTEGSMHNQRLQQDFNYYGAENFDFFILEKFLITDNSYNKAALYKSINYLEVYYIHKFKTNSPDYGYNVLIGGDNDINITEINTLINEEKMEREKWAYGDLAESKKLSFGIPDKYIPKDKIKFPSNASGLASIIGSYTKKDQNVENFEEYLNKFLLKYGKRDYVQVNKQLVPLLLAQQVLKIFPKTKIIKTTKSIEINTNATCSNCGKEVTEKVKFFCLSNKDRFKGNVYCIEHQKYQTL